jgi:hypothetical protein
MRVTEYDQSRHHHHHHVALNRNSNYFLDSYFPTLLVTYSRFLQRFDDSSRPVVLGVSAALESVSLYVAYQGIREGAAARNMTVTAYITRCVRHISPHIYDIKDHVGD